MAYRSDVRITMSKDGYSEFQKIIAEKVKETDLEDSLYGNLLDRLDVNYERKDNTVMIGWNNIKWLDMADNSIDIILDGLDELEDKDYGYRFIRQGESSDDYEERGNGEKLNDNVQYLISPPFERYFNDKEFINPQYTYHQEKLLNNCIDYIHQLVSINNTDKEIKRVFEKLGFTNDDLSQYDLKFKPEKIGKKVYGYER